MTNERTTLSLMVGGDGEDGKNPQNVQCADCLHVWIGFYLPQPISVAARMMGKLTCPKCGADSKRVRMHK